MQFADGDDSIFNEYKTIIDPSHLTPREAFAKAFNKKLEDTPAKLSVISWILPITKKIRASNKRRKRTPSLFWSYTRWYGEILNDALREYIIDFLTKRGSLAVAPLLQPYYEVVLRSGYKGYRSNWSERHIAYAAGLGTFGLSDGFITERGIAHRCGSIVTSLELPASSRTAPSPYANCLFYLNGNCRICVVRCPAGAITEEGHDKAKCYKYLNNLEYLKEKYDVGITGCGLCQTNVPCEFTNPVRQ